MEIVAVKAAGWVVGKALGAVTGTLLEAWAASKGLGPNVDALKVQLLYAQALLDNAQGREIHSPALKEMLQKLRQLAYDTDDLLDELDYFRIQDELDGTYHAANVHAGGCVRGLVLNARHTTRAIAGKVKLSSGSKLKFSRVEISTKMKDIIEHLRPLCDMVSNILNIEFMGTNRITRKDIAMKRPETTSDITDDALYGRDVQKKRIVDGITDGGEYFAAELTVLPIVGPGGIGKTTFTQHVYQEVQGHFQVSIWICVRSFNANRLAQEILKMIPELDSEKENASAQQQIEPNKVASAQQQNEPNKGPSAQQQIEPNKVASAQQQNEPNKVASAQQQFEPNKVASAQEQIRQRLKDRRFLLILDDMWTCDEDEWTKLLTPFRKGTKKGNMIVITTRLLEVAKMVNPVNNIQLERLENEDFMHFFEACVFSGQKSLQDYPELVGTGTNIVKKLKGFPLAAKTVGRLLRNQLTNDHWIRVLESKEWEHQTNDNDIMPALKLSYDYLPFHLQQCFYYCALFPEDYKYNSKELVHLWLGLGIIHPCGQNRRIEDIGDSYLNDLVNHGFFKKNKRDDGSHYYVVHDLLYDLAVNISSFECLIIHSSKLKSIQIPQDVRHLSIIVDNKDEDIETLEYHKNDLTALNKQLKVGSLRTLMLYGEHPESFAKIFCDLFEKAGALRAIYLSRESYNLEDVLCNFSKLIHLRYLRIKPAYMKLIHLPSALSRLYHLEVVDVYECEGLSSHDFTRHMSNLAKLHYFLVPEDKLQLHSNIVEVGKLKLLQELRRFEVGKESKGFELSQLGHLSELGGSLAICNLERIRETEEVVVSKMVHKTNLHNLTLEWDVNRPNKDPEHEANILEAMKPHSNIHDICIRGHGGTNCPKWLAKNLSVKNLESLHLDDVSWLNLPPLGQLWLLNEHGEEYLGRIAHNSFQNLRRLEFNMLPRLIKWAESDPCHMFPHLEILIITRCFELRELSISHLICCPQQKEAKINWFPKLRELKIEDCPKLLSFSPVPWTKAPCSAKIGVGSDITELLCENNDESGYSLEIKMKDALISELWNVLAFDNLTELKELKMDRCSPLPLHHFQMLSSLKTLHLEGGSSIVFPSIEGERHAESHSPVECIFISGWDGNAKELTQLLTYFPKLSELHVRSCKKITGLAVVEKEVTQTPALASSDNKVDDEAEIKKHQQQDGTRGEEQIFAPAAEELLLLPSQLQELGIHYCPELSLRSHSIDHNRESGQTDGGQGLQSLRSLRLLRVHDCPRFLSSYSLSSSSSCFPFPTSLEHLSLRGALGTATLLALSNFPSLIGLSIWGCGDLRGEGLLHLLVHGRLTRLTIRGTPNFLAGPELPREQRFRSCFSELQELETDDVTSVLAAPICTLLSFSLTELRFEGDREVERFTKEQEDALQLLTSLEEIRFWWCDKLQCLPAGLHRLPNLKRLSIAGCPSIWSLSKDGLPSSLQELEIYNCLAIQSLPKDCLPTSLQKLEIKNCPAIRSLPMDCLPSSLQKLEIYRCPAIRSLPKVNELPSSLRELDVRDSGNEELRRQCRKLIGIIPVVYAD